jgi:hypothetical protein
MEDGSTRVEQVQSFAQGDPYAPLGFSLAAQEVYEAVLQRAHDEGVPTPQTFLAYLDDLTAVSDWESLLRLFVLYVEEAKKVGVEVQLNKCRLYWQGAENPPPECIELAERLQLPIATELIEVGGIPIGKEHAILQWLEDLKLAHESFFKLVCHAGMGKWDGYQLLRASGIPRLSHVLRNLPPRLTKGIAEWFDGQVRTAFGHISGLIGLEEEYDPNVALSQPENEWIKVGISLPFRHGGLGLRSHAELIHAPFYAATAQVYHALTSRVECLKVESDTQHFDDSWMGQNLAESLEMLRDVPHTVKLLPSADSSFRDHYGTKCHLRVKLQKGLSSAIEADRSLARERAFPATETRETERRRLLQLPGASDVFCLLPVDDTCGNPVSDADFLGAVASWMGIPHGAQVVQQCMSGKDACMGRGGNWDHFQSCKWINGRTKKTIRHDGIRDVVCNWIRHQGLTALPEPLHLCPDGGGKHVDILLNGANNKTFLIDVLVVHSTGAGYAMRNQLGMRAIAAQENAKMIKFLPTAVAIGAEVVPFALDSTGVWGPSATQWLVRMLSDLKLDGEDREVERRRLQYLVAHRLHRGNAAMAREYANRNKRERIPLVPSVHFRSWQH